MQLADFFQRLVDCSAEDGFSFLVAGQEIAEPQRANGRAFLINAVFGAAFGLLSPASAGYFDKFDKATLVKDLEAMRDCCDVIGISWQGMKVRLRLGIVGDKLSDEALIGRCARIHERAEGFRKYAMSMVKTWLHDVRQPTIAEAFIVFSEHRAAKKFMDHFADKCPHYTYRKQLYTLALVVDLEDEVISEFKTMLTPKAKIPTNLLANKSH